MENEFFGIGNENKPEIGNIPKFGHTKSLYELKSCFSYNDLNSISVSGKKQNFEKKSQSDIIKSDSEQMDHCVGVSRFPSIKTKFISDLNRKKFEDFKGKNEYPKSLNHALKIQKSEERGARSVMSLKEVAESYKQFTEEKRGLENGRKGTNWIDWNCDEQQHLIENNPVFMKKDNFRSQFLDYGRTDPGNGKKNKKFRFNFRINDIEF